MSSFSSLKKYFLLFSIAQILSLANVHAVNTVAHRGGEGEHEHNRQHQYSEQGHSQMQHHQNQFHPSYGEAEGEGHRTGVFVAPQNGSQNQGSGYNQSVPDNPLYDAESQQLQQQQQGQ